MKLNTFLVATISIATLGTTTQSCTTLVSTDVGLGILKQILIGGINEGLNIFSNKDSFLGNTLIENALPQQLKDINSSLQKLGLNSVVEKEKDYIAQAAAFTVETSRPILVDAVNNLTTEDAVKIVQGGSGAATKILKERTSSQLMAAIAPKVDAKLNEFGIVKSLNTALAGSNLIGSLLGQNSSTSVTKELSNYASQQMVNGLFNIIENYEQQNASTLLNSLEGLK